MSWMILFKKQLFELEVKGQGPTMVIMVRNTPPYGHAPTYQISLTYLEKQKCYGPDKKILFKKQLFEPEVKGQGPMKVIQGSRWRAIRAKKSPCGCSLRFVLVPKEKWKSPYVSPSNEGRHIVLVWFFLPLSLLLSEAYPDHNFFVFRDRSMKFCMWVHDHRVVCRVP